MNNITKFAILSLTMFVCSCSNSVVWNIDNLNSIAGHKTTVVGTPKTIETEKGKAVEFDGIKDGLIVESLPLAGEQNFTVEVIFRPEPSGKDSQRLIYMQENLSKNRIVIAVESTPADKNRWHLDTFIKSDTDTRNLSNTKNLHPAGSWYNAALVYDGQKTLNYVNGVQQNDAKLIFTPLNEGKTSIGTKIDRAFWFKGVILKIRFTNRALTPQEFLKP